MSEQQQQPWLAHEKWSKATIDPNSSQRMLRVWAIPIIWFAMFIPILFILSDNEFGEARIELLAIVLFIAGSLLVLRAIWLTMNALLKGKAVLTLDPYPGSIGGQVGGTVFVNEEYDPHQHYEVLLSCVYRKNPKSTNGIVSRDVVWQSTGVAKTEQMQNGYKLKFCFDVEAELPESQPFASNYHYWQVNITAVGKSSRFDRAFEIPVFNTSKAAENLDFDSTQSPMAIELAEAEVKKAMKVSTHNTASGTMTRLTFGPFRDLLTSLLTILFSLVFGGAGIVANYIDAPLLFTIAFSAIGVLMVLHSIYTLLNCLTVEFTPGSIVYCRKLLGIPIKKVKIDSYRISNFEVVFGQQIYKDNKPMVDFKIKALTNDTSITVAESIKGKNAAQLALKKITELSNR